MIHGDELDSVRKRLDVIINLLMESTDSGDRTVTDRIHQLLGYGLNQSEVAEIVGKEPKYVSAVVSNRKRPKKSAAASEESP